MVGVQFAHEPHELMFNWQMVAAVARAVGKNRLDFRGKKRKRVRYRGSSVVFMKDLVEDKVEELAGAGWDWLIIVLKVNRSY